MSADTLRRLSAVIADLFDVNVATLHGETRMDAVKGWDSLQHLNLVLAVEEAFGIQLGPDEIVRMRTVGDIAAIVASMKGSIPAR